MGNVLPLVMVCLVAGAGVGFELKAYFAEPVAPDEPVARPVERIAPRGFDPTQTPPEIAAQCRREGLQFIAERSDGDDWRFDCVIAHITKKPEGGRWTPHKKRP